MKGKGMQGHFPYFSNKETAPELTPQVAYPNRASPLPKLLPNQLPNPLPKLSPKLPPNQSLKQLPK
jgi:hypothetical protein